MAHSSRGRYYGELEIGEVYEHQPGRTITEFDNTLFSLLTCNDQPLHVDAHYSQDTEFGQRIVNSMLTLSIVGGLAVRDMTLGTTVAALTTKNIEFPNPVFAGDTIYSETEVVDKRLSESRDDSGIVHFEQRGRNQHGDLVCKREKANLVFLSPENRE
jgi:acyl dehydratase